MRAPYVGTGIEYKAACDSGAVLLQRQLELSGIGDTQYVKVRRTMSELDEYKLLKFQRSQRELVSTKRPIVACGEHVDAGEVLRTDID